MIYCERCFATLVPTQWFTSVYLECPVCEREQDVMHTYPDPLEDHNNPRNGDQKQYE